jgi:hypothetical protein
VGAYRNRILRFEIGVAGGDPRRTALARWHTPAGVAIGSPVSAVPTHYPRAVLAYGGGLYDLWGPGRRTNTLFGSARGLVNEIEVDKCTAANRC